jgi:hypothetical protein
VKSKAGKSLRRKATGPNTLKKGNGSQLPLQEGLQAAFFMPG